MQVGILAAVLLYEIISILGVSWYLSRKQHTPDSFLLAGRSLPWGMLSVTLALTVLGTPHILGMFEQAWYLGAVSLWFSFAHVILLVLVCVGTGRWVRRLGVSSMPELISLLYGDRVRLIACCVLIPLVWGITTLELQGMGIIFSLLTGCTLKNGVLLGAVIGTLYVILAGLQEVAWLNILNAIVKYVGVIVATAWLTIKLPLGWSGVSQYYINLGQPYMLSVFGTYDTLLSYGIGIVIATCVCQGISQQLLQPAMAAKNEGAIVKAMWLATIINGMFAVFTVAMGLAAKSIPQFHALGPKMAAPAMLLAYLPGWLVALILAVFLGSVLSAFSMTVLAPATMFTKDIYVNLFHPGATPGKEKKVARAAIIGLVLMASFIATLLPPIVAAINWLFAWSAPMFIMIIVGLFWKRSTPAAITTLFLAWGVNIAWSFTSLPAKLGLQIIAQSNAYPTTVVSLVAGLVLTAALDGKPGYFKKSQKDVAADRVAGLQQI
jgi:solute:Na+ symporter, SSS family